MGCEWGGIYTAKNNWSQNVRLVFGSNLAGVHGAGAAAEAHHDWCAAWGIGEGPTGYSYAIPTKDRSIRTLPLTDIDAAVDRFIAYAMDRTDLMFLVTRIGCGLAGYTDAQIAPMFLRRGAASMKNLTLPIEWQNLQITDGIC